MIEFKDEDGDCLIVDERKDDLLTDPEGPRLDGVLLHISNTGYICSVILTAQQTRELIDALREHLGELPNPERDVAA